MLQVCRRKAAIGNATSPEHYLHTISALKGDVFLLVLVSLMTALITNPHSLRITHIPS